MDEEHRNSQGTGQGRQSKRPLNGMGDLGDDLGDLPKSAGRNNRERATKTAEIETGRPRP